MGDIITTLGQAAKSFKRGLCEPFSDAAFYFNKKMHPEQPPVADRGATYYETLGHQLSTSQDRFDSQSGYGDDRPAPKLQDMRNFCGK